jgi:Ser/Thr protein kinase RdoA (MazF antagonist)
MAPATAKHDLAAIVSRFRTGGEFLDAAPHGAGHINDTYASRIRMPGGDLRRFIHQRINTRVFRRPDELMENIRRVTEHQAAKARASGRDADRRCLTLVAADDGRPFHIDAAGNWWRTYLFIEGASTYDVAERAEHLEAAARAFARFQRQLADLPPPRLHETIPGFHDTPHRLAQFRDALAADAAGRADGCRMEIDFALARADDAAVLVDLAARGRLPERTTHNDTKLNNVMIDDRTGEGLCVIDLDTVMPGLALYDFGDLVRSGTNTGAEDERDLAKVDFDLGLFEAVVRGYLGEAREMLTPAEVDHLARAAELITYEIGLRFLADHLAGDVYFKTHRPGHNLDRCRTQFHMVAQMERRREEMERIVRRHHGSP